MTSIQISDENLRLLTTADDDWRLMPSIHISDENLRLLTTADDEWR